MCPEKAETSRVMLTQLRDILKEMAKWIKYETFTESSSINHLVIYKLLVAVFHVRSEISSFQRYSETRS